MSRARPRPRRGLVLGGGGVLGAAWMTGALHGLAGEGGWDLGEIEVVLGTSAGSVVGALLASGASASDMVAHQRGRRAQAGVLASVEWDYDTAIGGHLPPLPHLTGPASPRLLAGAARRLPIAPALERRLPTLLGRLLPEPLPAEFNRAAVLAGLIPAGRGSLAALRALGDDLQSRRRPPVALWVAAMSLDTAELTVFGSPGAPTATWGEALAASCAIPGWFAPVRIHGVRYVDGGAVSTTNADRLTGRGLTEVVVVVPSGTTQTEPPAGVRARMAWQWRHRITERAERECAALAAEGVRVTLLLPGEEDLEVLGHNSMAAGRRLAVLHTAMRTTGATLRAQRLAQDRAVPSAG